MNFSTFGRIFAISGKKIFEWYRNVLSGYTDPEEQLKLHEYDTKDPHLIDYTTKKIKTVFVPILRPENMGEEMAIDDKCIGGEGYTILSNKKTGKIAAMVMSVKAGILGAVLSEIPHSLSREVKSISKDLADSYDWVARTLFMNATRVADKFHILREAFEQLQAVRIRFRQEVLAQEKVRKKTDPLPMRAPAHESIRELLARGRYLLFTFKTEWTDSQAERAKDLFLLFPDIEIAYSCICSFRSFYNCGIGNKKKAQKCLSLWYQKIQSEAGHIPEMISLMKTIQSHEDQILNYFEEGQTNAFAESLNNKIQRFVQSNYGIRDRDFFHFRIKKYFS